MVKRIFRSILLTALAAMILVSAFIMIPLYNEYESRVTYSLQTEAGYIKHALSLENDEMAFFAGFYSHNRITLIAEDGTVLFDNTADPAQMENHSDRPEVIAALETGEGQSLRYSDTLAEKTIYYAVKTGAGNVLRISATQSTAFGMLRGMIPAFVLIVVAVAVLSFILARYQARRIVAPVNAIDLDAPFDSFAYDELSPLLLRIERQREELAGKMRELTEKQREFEAVSSNMREGLILLSQKGNIISINSSAAEIFGARMEDCAGKNILMLNRSVALQSVVEGTGKGLDAEARLKIRGRYYQLLGSRVKSGGGAEGTVILVLDVTDRQSAEESRREFTANVSHELKTPLTSILGYAEIMKNGVAKPGDMKDFAGRIHNEAGRLIALVEDILRLSQLDEKAKLPEKEHVDLYALSEDVCGRLRDQAKKYDVTLKVDGAHAVVSGIRKILDEMIFNLCDNAIKYNVRGGSVEVLISESSGKPAVTVSDTGIGIPEEHQMHVFERFYRVDKSHSKETGGTGLGLSIVKHGAAIHEAEISLESKVNEGTSVKIVFPAAEG